VTENPFIYELNTWVWLDELSRREGRTIDLAGGSERAGARPEAEYWPTVIAAVERSFPDFVFLAEAYWDLEWTLQQQGFDYCYDKRLYDRLAHDGGSRCTAT
jgi:hypothetical protein